MERMIADLLARNAKANLFTCERVRELDEATSLRRRAVFGEAANPLLLQYIRAKFKEVRLLVFAPLHDIGLLPRLRAIVGLLLTIRLGVFLWPLQHSFVLVGRLLLALGW